MTDLPDPKTLISHRSNSCSILWFMGVLGEPEDYLLLDLHIKTYLSINSKPVKLSQVLRSATPVHKSQNL